jgi:hypothetical protein
MLAAPVMFVRPSGPFDDVVHVLVVWTMKLQLRALLVVEGRILMPCILIAHVQAVIIFTMSKNSPVAIPHCRPHNWTSKTWLLWAMTMCVPQLLVLIRAFISITFAHTILICDCMTSVAFNSWSG